ncbi:hypothetical protein BAMA_22390 [Bacillus manliponensis]|uniref:HD domain-containing protein n=1 Tax=Bacillus manliponensis TaxID=574376 RepID=A0A073JX19_9BACI|nr:HD domain-containing protein [Bacillus manliponensis]KEK19544.1 hypothetical protein BAMA_22390 [Bacillus manliponensis]
MKICDSIYGEYEIDGVLEELIQTKAMQRLKNIHQGGASFLVNPKWNVPRYEHSIGVMLLVKMLGGTVEEQIAALLHDVSHTAFSHVIDHVLHTDEENYHEEIFQDVIQNSEIPAVLKKYGYTYTLLQEWEKWTLLERPLPLLCADRIDYTLRDLYTYGMISKEDINQFLPSLIVKENQICVSSLYAAEWFVKVYYKETLDFFLHPLNAYGYSLLISILKRALEKRIIQIEDFLTDDWEIIKRLQSCEDEKTHELLTLLQGNVQIEENKDEYDICYGGGKERIVDPSVYIDGEIKSASSLSLYVRECNGIAKARFRENMYLKIKKN